MQQSKLGDVPIEFTITVLCLGARTSCGLCCRWQLLTLCVDSQQHHSHEHAGAGGAGGSSACVPRYCQLNVKAIT